MSGRRVPLGEALARRLAGTSALRHLDRFGWNPLRHPDLRSGRMGRMSEIDGMGTERATCVLAPNPSMMTLDGTNTWIIGEPGADEVAVVDPGPDDRVHLARILEKVGDRRVGVVLLTHRHPDHAAGAARFAGMAGAGVGVRALDPRYRLGDEGLAEGDVITTGGLELRVLEIPGHTDDSVAFWLPADRAVFTGDTVLGYGTTVLEGRLGDYLSTLERLRELAGEQDVATLLPGHGPRIDDPAGALDGYLAHRRERLAQVEEAVRAGARTAREVVEIVYADVDRKLWPAAEWSVQSQLDYLDERG
ncbi:MBL fold metallo-hydrolase [Actinomadura macrotermitis]|uniref:Hydroxyacylglutathione hydrolase n=1 Tax=Actinomadura macrotermitis TaxID=2585200 RepID=A0A7K0BXT5_9ACTN|nr:MBL fold metallo-hydrolase [Actinomadura macrotermitis]MQY05454.1 Hydroxyacylglutathione hydrolase [Actinomadura macrotermitis]